MTVGKDRHDPAQAHRGALTFILPNCHSRSLISYDVHARPALPDTSEGVSMKILKVLADALAGVVGLFFHEPKWVGTLAYEQETARRNAQLDQVAQLV